MMGELVRLKEAIKPDEILLVADGMTGQDAVKIAQGFDAKLGVTGVILTKMDGDARGGAALSIYGVLKKPIKYIGVGEKSDALEDFHPDRMAGRILQQGDIVSLVEKAQGAFDADEAKKMERKVRKEGMDLEDFLTAMRQIDTLGPLEGLLKMMPGVNSKMLKQVKQADPKRMKHVEAIVLSMTLEERKTPGLMNGSRRARVAKGSGRPISEVNRLLEQFREMQKMMKKATASGGAGGEVKPTMIGGMPCDPVPAGARPGAPPRGAARPQAHRRRGPPVRGRAGVITMTSVPPELIIVGRVRKAHGIRGALGVEPITDEPDAVFAPGRRVIAGNASGDPSKDRRELHVTSSTPFKGGYIIHFTGIEDRNAADTWRERFLL